MIEYEIKPSKRFSFNIKELWQYKELFYFFTWRDIKVKYKQTVLGFIWAILQPCLMMLVIAFLFGKAVGANAKLSLPYPIFVYSGLILWGIFSGGLQSAGNSMLNNANIIKKIYFPRLIIPLSSILVSIFDFVMTLIPFAFLLIYFRVEINLFRLVFFFPISLLIILLTTFGMGSFLAALNVKYRDFRYVLPFLVQFLMFASPVLYPLNIVREGWGHLLLEANPISVAINLFRSLFDGEIVHPYSIIWGILGSAFLFLFGIFYFRKTEGYFADLS